MTLPSDFQFSQSSLQDYVDCPRKFYLRYVQQAQWPAVMSEPVMEQEQYMLQGAAFHQLVQQHLSGLPADILESYVTSDELSGWWSNYLTYAPGEIPGERFVEVSLSTPLADFRLVAKYDLLVVQPEQRAVILDWKTSRKRVPRSILTTHLQTRVYPYVLIQAGTELCGGKALSPDRIEMIYWFSAFPTEPEKLPYSTAQYEIDARYLQNLMIEIAGLEEPDFLMTSQQKKCGFCVYRSLCDRGVRADDFDEIDDESEDTEALQIDFDQIEEIAF